MVFSEVDAELLGGGERYDLQVWARRRLALDAAFPVIDDFKVWVRRKFALHAALIVGAQAVKVGKR